MRIFIAGASGAIGRPLIDELLRLGHSVVGMTHSKESAKRLNAQGIEVELASALDAEAVENAMRRAKPEVVIDQLTSLPKNPADMPEYLPNDRKLRDVGGGNLHRAAQAAGARRYVQQSSGFYLAPGDGLGDESTPLAVNAGGNVGLGSQMYELLEKRVLECAAMEGLAMRYGFFYGPNTWYHPDGAVADQLRLRQSPVIGKGEGIWCFVHIDDAAIATAAALTAVPQSASGCRNLRSSWERRLHLESAKMRLVLKLEMMLCTTVRNFVPLLMPKPRTSCNFVRGAWCGCKAKLARA